MKKYSFFLFVTFLSVGMFLGLRYFSLSSSQNPTRYWEYTYVAIIGVLFSVYFSALANFINNDTFSRLCRLMGFFSVFFGAALALFIDVGLPDKVNNMLWVWSLALISLGIICCTVITRNKTVPAGTVFLTKERTYYAGEKYPVRILVEQEFPQIIRNGEEENFSRRTEDGQRTKIISAVFSYYDVEKITDPAMLAREKEAIRNILKNILAAASSVEELGDLVNSIEYPFSVLTPKEYSLQVTQSAKVKL